MYWFWLAISIAAAVLAFGATLAAWRVRRTTPRTTSLALSVAACVAVGLTIADLELPLPAGLCVASVPAGPPTLAERLSVEFEDWTWRLRPCGRVHVEPTDEDLLEELNIGKLAAEAAGAGVAVDVELGGHAATSGQSLVWVHDAGTLPISTPIPVPSSDEVRPRLAGDLDRAVSCRVDQASEQRNPQLSELLDNSNDAPGFHRLACKTTEGDARPVVAYVRLTEGGVLVVSSQGALDSYNGKSLVGHFDLKAAGTYGLEMVRAVSEHEWLSAPNAAMVVLDRPQDPRGCAHAKKLLDRGGTVILSMPDETFVKGCDWLPIETRRRTFDRRPRLTFVFDDNFSRDLGREPSCVFGTGECAADQASDAELESGLELQRQAAKRACRGIAEVLNVADECEDFGTVGERADRVVTAHTIPLVGRPITDRDRLNRTSPPALLDDLRQNRSATTLWENELVIPFTFDPGPDLTHREIVEFLDQTAARVHIVRIRDPYGLSLRNANPTNGEREAIETTLLAEPADRVSLAPSAECSGTRCLGEVGLPRQFADSTDDTQAHANLRESARGRFVTLRGESVKDGPAPLKFTWWSGTRQPGNQPPPTELATTTEAGGLRERPLAVGTVIGRGHLLVLAYSPFERWKDDKTAWSGAPETHRNVLGGLRWIEDLYGTTRKLMAEVEGAIASVHGRPDGSLWVGVFRGVAASEQPDLDVLEFTGEDIRIAAPLVDFDPDRRLFVYALPAAELEASLERCTALKTKVAALASRRTTVVACPPAPSSEASSVMDAGSSLELLAHYTGGRVMERDDASSLSEPSLDRLHVRPVGLGSLALVFLVAWGRRAIRRLRGGTAYRKLRSIDQAAQRRYDPPDAVVAAAGDWGGRTSTWARTGAFGGYRPLEPGDRVSAVVFEDLALRGQSRQVMLPRVSVRIEEAAPVVSMYVNVGASMRVPAGRVAGKAVCAGRIAMHIAASAWKIRGEVRIEAVGVRGEPEILAPSRLSPGQTDFEMRLRQRLCQPTHRGDRPWPDDLPECGALVYVSDFQLEDEQELLEWLANLEGSGTRVAGVMVYSPLEFTMIEGGRLAGSGIWADRADWDPDDAFEAFGRRLAVIERIFDAVTTGGLVVVATHYAQDDIEMALEGGRLLQILR